MIPTNNRHGLSLWSNTILQFEAGLPEKKNSRDLLIETNTNTDYHIAIRITGDQDHGIRLLSIIGKLGPPVTKPYHHSIVQNRFEGNINTIEQVGFVDISRGK